MLPSFAKLFNFLFSMPIPESKTYVQFDSIIYILVLRICGSRVLHTLCYTERRDVYALGVISSELFTKKSYLDLLGYLDPYGIVDTSNSEIGYWYAPMVII